MLTADRDANVARYRQRYAEFGYDPRTLGWTKGRQPVRFAAALAALGTTFGSILDVGCGFGDFFGHLHRSGWRGRYVGIDLVPELLAEARIRYGELGAGFIAGEVADIVLDEPCDVAVALGLFNHRLRQDNYQFIEETLDAMWRLTTDCITADFLCATADRPREDLFYADAGRVAASALRRSRRVVLNHGYMPFEFCVQIWHDDSFSEELPVFAPYMACVTGRE
jgi:SAM-dependent methyltransferase